MRGWGGRFSRGTSVARAFAVAALALLLAQSTIFLTAEPAEAQAAGDPWWGPSSRDEPTSGWAVRIPVVVENNRTHTVRNHPVAVELDFTKILLEGGWTSQSVGAEARLRGFTLDVDSIRVVEYQRGFSPGPVNGQSTEPTPHAFYPALLTGARTRDFDPARNPAGTVMFTVDQMAPQEKRFFYVYANPLEFGQMAPPKFDLAKVAPLDAYLWGSTGNVVYGYEPAQSNQNHRVHVAAATSLPTKVTVYVYNVGRFQPLPATTSFPNPIELGASLRATSFLIPSATPFKIVADNPITVAAHGNGQQVGTSSTVVSSETFGYVPASDTQSFLGRVFPLYGFMGSASGVPGNVVVIKSGPGSVDVRSTMTGASITLTAANPVQRLRVAIGWDLVTATGDVLVSTSDSSTAAAFHAHDVPAITGGPLGTEFYVRVPRDAGYMRICPEANMTLRIVDLSTPSRQLFPEGPFETTGAARLSPTPGCHLERTNAAYPDGTPIDLFSTREPVDPVPDSPVPFRLSVGAGARQTQGVETRPHIGPYGGYRGNDYYVEGAVGLFGHFPDTKVVVTEYRNKGAPLTYTLSLPEDGFLQLTPRGGDDSARRYHLVGAKPFTAVSTESVITPRASTGHSYGYMLAGRPVALPVEIGTAQFRGPLVDLRSTESDSRQIFRATGPATKAQFNVQVLNLGRWIGGENLPAEIELTCEDVPLTWKVEDCNRRVRLNSREALDVTIGVTPSEEDVDSTRTILVTARSAGSNVTAQLRLIVFVEIRYGVGMWFDVEGGRKSIEPAVGLNPAETYRYNILLKNTGSSADRFELTVEPPRDGWRQELQLGGERVSVVELDAGESVMLQFVVTAPDAETAQQNIVRITAKSVSNALAADVVNTATRIRPKIDVRLELDPPTRVAKPNETAVFNLTLRNEGNDIFTIRLREDSILPEGWTSEIRLPNNEVSLNPRTSVNVPLLMTPPPGALAGDLAASKITAEIDIGDGGGAIRGDEVGAVVVVRKINNVSIAYDAGVATESGTTLVYPVTIGNDGNGDELVELLPGASDPRWRLATSIPDLRVPVNGSMDVDLLIDVPTNVTPGLYNYTFTVRLSREAFQNLTVPVEVLPTAKLDFRGIDDLSVLPGQARRLEATVVNVGNVEGDFVFATDAPEGWSVTFEPAGAKLLPGESRRVQVSVNASRTADDGAYRLTFKADGSDAVSGNRTVAAALGRPDLYVEGVETSGRPSAGDLLLVTATLGNRGDVAAEDVKVALVIDGLVVDQVVLSRVPVGDATIARLSWLATGSPGTVSVRIDPENSIVETSRDENEALVQFGSRLTPAPGALGLLAAVGVGLLLASRRRSQ